MSTIGCRAGAFVCLFGAVLTASAVEPYQEYRKRIESAQALSALNGGAFGDSVSLYNGATEFHATDIDIPGNNSLPVRLSRRFTVKLEPAGAQTYNPDLGGAGMWDIEVPYITGMFAAQYSWTSRAAGSKRCSVMTTPSMPASISTHDVWQGYSVHVPGESERTLLLSEAQTPQPTDGLTRRWSTRERDSFTCIPMKSGLEGEGFSMLTSGGVRYDFDVAATRAAGTMTQVYKSSFEGTLTMDFPRSRIFLLASKISDRFGNTVNLTYNAAGHPTQIASSDGRTITLNYVNGRLSSASAAGRTWDYHYVAGSDESEQLTKVERPDGSSWSYSYVGSLRPPYEMWDGSSNSTCSIRPPPIAADYTVQVRHPGGALGTFSFSNMRHFRSGIHMSECLQRVQDGSYYWILNTPNYFDVMSLKAKSISGPGLSQSLNWTYDYGRSAQPLWGSSSQAAAYPCLSCATEKTVVVANPDSTTLRYRYGFQYALNEGRLLGSSLVDAVGATVRTELTDYLPDSAADVQQFHGRYGLIINGDDPSSARVRPIIGTAVVQDGRKFSWSVAGDCGGTYCFDNFAKPTKVIKSSSDVAP